MNARSSLSTSLLGALFLAASAGMGFAQSSTVREGAADLRLFAASGDDTPLGAGLSIELDSGWKTYWLYPGPVGLPPRIDFAGSHNLASAQVLWPAPRRFDDGTSQSAGYSGSVILPLRLTAEDPAKPVDLRLNMEFGLCSTICVPASAQLALELKPGAGADAMSEARLAGFEQRVPSASILGDDDDLAIVSAVRGSEPHAVDVAVRAPKTAKMVDLFAEDPDGVLSALPKRLAERGDGSRIYRLQLRKSSHPTGLTLVAVADGRAISVALPLDGSLGSP
ncbi:protein-disulfide reductase DsbD domain-containing protein [Terrihabitans sp. B22-R8]|uniref:protein-disulfide reductase DsbD domain-containing protein n=1 Tax=Terrihabitans sp. B22-R8 TaxID=3425128 RepID=UPI00403D451E